MLTIMCDLIDMFRGQCKVFQLIVLEIRDFVAYNKGSTKTQQFIPLGTTA